MAKKIHRNESTSTGKRIWKAVDQAAAQAPQKAVSRIKSGSEASSGEKKQK